MKKNYSKNFNRREFLYNSAGGMASAAAINTFSQRALAADSNIKRLIVWYIPEGCAQQAFWPVNLGKLDINPNAGFANNTLRPNPGGRSGQGSGNPSNHWSNKSLPMASYCLQPLMGLENDISLYSGFQNYGGSGSNDDHVRAVSGALTGGTPNNGSIDQIVGRDIQGTSALDSVYFSVYGAFVNGSGSANNFLSPIRTIGGGLKGSAIWNPVEIFNSIFPNGIPQPAVPGQPVDLPYGKSDVRLNALRGVEARIREVQCLGGNEASNKLEALLQTYLKAEKATQALIDADEAAAGNGTNVDIPDGWANPDNIVNNRNDDSYYWNNSDNFEKMLDISIETTVAAFALDRTRVSAIQCCGSGQDSGSLDKNHYRKIKLWDGLGSQQLEGSTDLNDHFMSHDGQDITKRNQAKIFQWYYSKLRTLVEKLQNTPDAGGGSLFDNTMILACSEFGGRDHHHHDTPFMLLGGENMDFRRGQYIDSYDRNSGTHLDSARFLHGVTNTMGLNLNQFGRSNTPFTL